MHFRFVGLAIATLTLFVAVACGGGDGTDSPTWDLTKANDLSHAALLTAQDLPSGDWSFHDDAFDDDPKTPPVCAEFEALRKDASAANVARAKRAFETPGVSANNIGNQVESSVDVYRDAKTANDMLMRYKTLIDGGNYGACFEADISDSNVKATVKKATAVASAPHGGYAAALELELVTRGGTAVVRAEVYTWTSGNGVIALSIGASKETFSADLVKQAIGKQDSAVRDALKGTRKPASE